jgi:predicted TIM-barrel fold metal-dependent hydrolase
MSLVPADLRIVDCDSHLTEYHDLWTRRAPAAYRRRVPRVEKVGGRDTWVMEDGAHRLGFAGAGSVIDPHGNKTPFLESMTQWSIGDSIRSAWDTRERLKMLDEFGIYAQVMFPNSIGLGGQELQQVKDAGLRQLCLEIWNDDRLELQAESGNRFLPMPILPAWDVQACVREARRVAALGARGVNMTSDPQDLGAPDLASPAWDPLWEVLTGLQLPVHLHIGASLTAMNFYGNYFWPSQDEYVKPAIGGTMLFINNARVVVNSILCGMFDRNPGLKFVSVESGIGWVPFILETTDYEVAENAPQQFARLGRKPSEYFRDHWYATYWFERNPRGSLQALFDAVGEDNVLFETDFPHPTCLYPRPVEQVADQLAQLRPSTRRKLLGENALKLYRL